MTTLLSAAQVAAQLDVPSARVRRLLMSGRLRGQKVGRSGWVLPADEVERVTAAGLDKLEPVPTRPARLLSAAEAAQKLERHPSLVRKLLHEGRLRGQQIGGTGWVVTESEVARFATLDRPPFRPPRTGLTATRPRRAA